MFKLKVLNNSNAVPRFVLHPIILLAFIFSISNGAEINIRGYIYDFATNKPVVGATAQLLTNKYSSVTDSTGYFLITQNSASLNKVVQKPVALSFEINSSTIRFTVGESKSPVSIDAYSMNGCIFNLFSGSLTPGEYSVYMQKTNLSTGCYIIKATIGNNRFVARTYVLPGNSLPIKANTVSSRGSTNNMLSKCAAVDAAAWDTLLINKSHYNVTKRALATSTDSVPLITIKVNVPPAMPSNLSPLDKFEFYTDSLSVDWYANDPDNGKIHCNLYFGLTNPPQLFMANVGAVGRSFGTNVKMPGGWQNETPYYWYVEVSDGIDSVQSAVFSVLHFTTVIPQNLVWTKQSSFFSSDDLCDVFFLDSLTGWVADGSSGNILRTDDGGTNWKLQYQIKGDMYRCIYSVYFTDSNNGYACGRFDTLFYTNDGGTNWLKKTLVDEYTISLNCVRFKGQRQGWIVGPNGIIIHTIDGGTNWNVQNSPVSRTLYDICLFDSLTGWIAGDSGTILKTTNGGSTWSVQTTGIVNNLSTVFFVDSLNGWAGGGNGRMLHTSDGGSSWSVQNAGVSEMIRDIFFLDTLNGYIVNLTGNGSRPLHKTNDGGKTWSSDTGAWTPIGGWLFSIYFLPDRIHGWAVGPDGVILRTCDGSQTWKRSRTSLVWMNFQNVCALSAKNAWAVATNSTIVHTVDGGTNWQQSCIGDLEKNFLSGMAFIDSLHGWIVGNGSSSMDSNAIFSTIDGGTTWIPQLHKKVMLNKVHLSIGLTVGRLVKRVLFYTLLMEDQPGRAKIRGKHSPSITFILQTVQMAGLSGQPTPCYTQQTVVSVGMYNLQM
jgi:photosystem II stability/assembly factor-like uncharacterized protein